MTPLLILIFITPAMGALIVAARAWAQTDAKTLSLASVVFMTLLAGLTCSVHFSISPAGCSRSPA